MRTHRSLRALCLQAAVFAGLAALGLAGHGPVGLTGAIVVNGALNGSMNPQLPATWIFGFKDAEGEFFTDFEQFHGKHMQLFVISEDLADFAHFFPAFKPASGLFRVRVNDWNDDPDNADAMHAARRAGRYMLFSEVKPYQGHKVESRYTVVAEGQPQPQGLNLDPVAPDGSIVKYFDELGQPGAEGDFYRITLRAPAPREGDQPGRHLKLRLDHKHADQSEYHGIHDLEPWMGTPGQVTLISQAGEGAAGRSFRHACAGHGGGHGDHELAGDHDHGDEPGAGPELGFGLHGQLPAGTYKAWFQVQHHGAVRTFPFVLALGE